MISFPKIIQIETSLVCNSHCVFCPHNEMKRGPLYMEEHLWKKIVDESRGRGIIYRPFMVNEPFVELRMPEIIRYIKQDETAVVEFNSNGNIAAKTDVEAIIAAGTDIIRFSIDAFSPESFKASGRGGDYNKIVSNVLRFVEEKKKQKSKCFIEVRMIDLEENRHEHADFVKFWSNHADKATITSLYSWPWSGQTSCAKLPCPKVREEMFFMSDGRAVLCCWDAFGRGVIGNVNDNTVEEIWLGKTMQQCKEWLNNGEREKIHLCSRCDAYQNYDFSNWKGY